MLQTKIAGDDGSVSFTTKDGARLVGRLFHPEGTPRAVLVLNGATAVPQEYYRHFARHAAEAHGMAVLTYDYRDMGRSRFGPVRGSRTSMSDWGLADQEAARAEARRLFPGLPLRIIGHSLGGMTLPMQQGCEDIEQVTCVASGNVHHGDHPWPYRGNALMFWFGLGPLLVALLGYLPGRRMGLGQDLPAPAYWQWRKWCITYLTCGGEAGQSLPPINWRGGKDGRARLRFVAFADDHMTPPIATMRLAEDYGRNREDVEVVTPRDRGLTDVGHMGAFARRNAVLWDDLLS